MAVVVAVVEVVAAVQNFQLSAASVVEEVLAGAVAFAFAAVAVVG